MRSFVHVAGTASAHVSFILGVVQNHIAPPFELRSLSALKKSAATGGCTFDQRYPKAPKSWLLRGLATVWCYRFQAEFSSHGLRLQAAGLDRKSLKWCKLCSMEPDGPVGGIQCNVERKASGQQEWLRHDIVCVNWIVKLFFNKYNKFQG